MTPIENGSHISGGIQRSNQLKFFVREEIGETLPMRVFPVPLGEKGEVTRYNGRPPRVRSFAAAVTSNHHAVLVSFPNGPSYNYGYHSDPEGYLVAQLGRDIPILHGDVGSRIVTIHARHPADVQTMGGQRAIEEMISRTGERFRLGVLKPEEFVDNNLAQVLLRFFEAELLRITLDPPSTQIYHVG